MAPETLLFRLVWRPNERMEPFRIDHCISDGDMLPLAGGLRAVDLPGHCAGQVGLLRHGHRLLIAGDVFINNVGLGDPVGFENESEGRRSQRKLAPAAVCFGHRKAITRNAAARLDRAARRRGA